ncbi:branched-chain amino acid ABC transporter permease [Modestobacter muralis]|uniref:Branched-chain amino acid ABC transporter permease n=1 Tax=Modestobacter muralis TaxID=1608614 RepID=A0A6P0H8G1_9ACTN|nr:branched-chain amino acid ABC transporter permease [Modestobacter muralis]NEN52127.1 branched-chain amino acid ABC transporter permease [Modestobacter muralis]
MFGFFSSNLITVVDGIAFGVLLFTIALGLSLVFGVMDVLSLAHGSLYLIGSYIAVSVSTAFTPTLGFFVLALVLAVALGSLAGAGLSFLTRPLASRGHLDQALLTLGVAFVVGDLLAQQYGREVRTVAPPSPFDGSVSVFGSTYPTYRLVIIAVGLALAIAAYLVIERTKMGALVQATVADAQMVRALGVNTGRLMTGVFAVGAALAAFGGVLGAPILNAAPGLDNRVLILGLVVVVIGGLGSVAGAFVGALVIGQVQTLGVSLAPSYAAFLTFGAMALVLLLRPAGILGKGRLA